MKTDALVVLGRGVRKDGSLGLIARARVDRALQLYAMGVAPRVIFTGHSALMSEGQPEVTEADAMASYARTHQLPPKAIFIEDQSRDTIGNAYFVLRRYLEPNDWNSIRVVTSDFHIQRTAWVFQKVLGLGYDVSFSPSPSELDHSTIAARAREESDISTFLMDWIGDLPDGDPLALARLIWQDHPGYAPQPTMTREEIQSRVSAIGKIHRTDDLTKPRGHRMRQERIAEL
jgi:uncharacterized SAM-binding protein YcdF (DUF218 family)